ncbi:TCP-1/Cpn60 chaperonin family protein [Teladorsagia circumcincta]|uniref:TCP-1/Cpn60 chaperonin family protein n=1 Tax=Teladorsagia circumcincta TaxID=45464 RepID=A0A2G9UJH1_TELCI|nr:TCP-1/Cpn60 chaperonin family protein [Teladorsagia circumcincta]
MRVGRDEETGDGTTSVIVLAGEVMAQAQQFLEQKIHPTIIIQAYRAALEDMIKLAEEKYSRTIDVNNDKEITSVVKSCLGTKMLSKWMDLAVQISMDAIKTIRVDKGSASEIDIKRVCGARIVNDTTDLRESDVGTQADLFEILKIGDEYYTYVTSEKTTACTICLRGPSKDVINEVERNLQDSLHVVRNIMLNPRLVPGGGALEMALAQAITEKGKSMEGVRQWPYKAIARALEVIPRTLIQNCAGNTIRQLTALRAKHAQNAENWTWGINGTTGELVDMCKLDIWDPLTVRVQVLKTAVETSIMLLRIDDIVSGTKKTQKDGVQEEMPQ